MSSAFDTIKREKLLDILPSFRESDELRVVRLLLSNITLTIKLNNVKAEPFQSKQLTKLGSLLGDNEDVCMREQLSTVALNKLSLRRMQL